MNMEFYRKLPTPKELKEEFPASDKIQKIKAERDAEIRAIFEGKNDKLLLVIGPCSADREDAVLEYIGRLVNVQEKVKDKIFIIPRIYKQAAYSRYRLQGYASSARPGKKGRYAKGHHLNPRAA